MICVEIIDCNSDAHKVGGLALTNMINRGSVDLSKYCLLA